MNVTVTALGAVIALVIAITLIIKKVHPAYGLILGALIGGLVGGAGLTGTVNLMMDGAKNMMPAILRILTAGVLAGVLIESGAAAKIAETIVEKIGESRALIALAIATMVLTMVGVFVDVSVITVSPIALAIAHKSGLSKPAILLAMVGGGKAGNIMSPNPNTIAAADNLGVSLTNVMIAGIVPAIFGVIITCILASRIKQKGSLVESDEHMKELTDMPGFLPAMVGPLVAIILLMLRPIAGIAIDPLIALPVGGICGILAMGKIKHINKYATYGLAKMSGVAILLIGTGTLAGIIANSGLKDVIISGINARITELYVSSSFRNTYVSGNCLYYFRNSGGYISIWTNNCSIRSGTTCYSSYDTCWGYSFRSLTSWKLLPRYWWKCFNGHEGKT